MPRRFTFDDPEYSAFPIDELRWQWRNVPDAGVRSMVAVEHQYLDFHLWQLHSIRHEPIEGGAAIPIGLSLRAGALKTANLVCASIAEAVLRAHAERRGYSLPKHARHRTLGRILGAWQDADGNPHPDIAPIWEDLQRLYDGRNVVHLYAALDRGSDFYDVLQAEQELLESSQRVIEFLQGLESA